MDKEQEELQFLGFFGIFKESFNVLSSWRRIFTQITLAIILPLSFIFLSQIEISHLIFTDIRQNNYALDRSQFGTPSYKKISDAISSERTAFVVFKIVYLIFFLILSLLSTSAVVYTIACIYTAKEVTFKKVISVVPKVWKRLVITFLCYFAIVFVYNFGAITVFTAWIIILMGSYIIGVILGFVFVLLYLMGFVYISVVWHLACVVSVLEDFYGIQAMRKSKELIKGKMGVAVAVFVVYNVGFIGIELMYGWYVVLEDSIVYRIGFGTICLNFIVLFMLFGLVIQTVIYFVCKSYHHENIDKSSLADHLEVYLGDYVPLKSKDVQLEHFDV